jgi:hypothetical protein
MTKIEIVKFSPLEAWSFAFLGLGICLAVVLPEWSRLSHVSSLGQA